MATAKFDVNELDKRMRASLDALKREFGGLRTGRASASLLDPITVQVYGQRMPLNQVGTVSVPEARMLTVQVWDKAAVAAVDRAIRESNLGINPVVDGTIIRLPIPALTTERRQELIKIAHKYTEQARIAVRNVRRDGMEVLKKLEKDGQMSQDEHKKNSAKVQELTDKLIKEIDQLMAGKDAEINKV
jgi:ribosome recycling factor